MASSCPLSNFAGRALDLVGFVFATTLLGDPPAFDLREVVLFGVDLDLEVSGAVVLLADFVAVLLAVDFLRAVPADFVAVFLLAVLVDFLRAAGFLPVAFLAVALRVGLRVVFLLEDRRLDLAATGLRRDVFFARVCLLVLLDDDEDRAEAFFLPDFLFAGVMGAGR